MCASRLHRTIIKYSGEIFAQSIRGYPAGNPGFHSRSHPFKIAVVEILQYDSKGQNRSTSFSTRATLARTSSRKTFFQNFINEGSTKSRQRKDSDLRGEGRMSFCFWPACLTTPTRRPHIYGISWLCMFVLLHD